MSTGASKKSQGGDPYSPTRQSTKKVFPHGAETGLTASRMLLWLPRPKAASDQVASREELVFADLHGRLSSGPLKYGEVSLLAGDEQLLRLSIDSLDANRESTLAPVELAVDDDVDEEVEFDRDRFPLLAIGAARESCEVAILEMEGKCSPPLEVEVARGKEIGPFVQITVTKSVR